MTQTPEFDTFSQMLDAEDDLQGFDLTEDQKLQVKRSFSEKLKTSSPVK